MDGVKYGTNHKPPRQIAIRPPPIILESKQLNISKDIGSVMESFFSPNISAASWGGDSNYDQVARETRLEPDCRDPYAYGNSQLHARRSAMYTAPDNERPNMTLGCYPYRPSPIYTPIFNNLDYISPPSIIVNETCAPMPDVPRGGCQEYTSQMGRRCDDWYHHSAGRYRRCGQFYEDNQFAAPPGCVTPASSEGYSSDCSWANRNVGDGYVDHPHHTRCPTDYHSFVPVGSPLGGSPNIPLPPPAYADVPQEETFFASQDPYQTQSSDVSDFFSQPASASGSTSPECSPRAPQDDDVGNLSLSSEKQSPFDAHIVSQHLRNISYQIPQHPNFAPPSSSLSGSPLAKRGRFSPLIDATSPGRSVCAPSFATFERYHSEYAKDTYEWLRHREVTKHAIGVAFMDAQKKDGASWGDRRAVVIRALVEMKKRKHTLEATHLGAYILDKCLDSFHVVKTSLSDVCAVSMVLGTKMEEYESLRPGNVDGLCGATADRARLCDIEKRIVHQMRDGLCFTTPLVFAYYMLAELGCDAEQIRLAQYILNLALLDSAFRDEGGPRVAHAAVCITSAIVWHKNSNNLSEKDALLKAEHGLFDLTKFSAGSTRDVMRKLVLEMDRAVREKHAVLVDYLSEDNRRVCFCEVSPALWNVLYGSNMTLNASF
ncbi:hypothetical protein Q1695_008689 [Nippostrongylus brasiliensis]|nr:hypothetical protein Q1695_008689 [Nippostrongylus brasiliensis]